MSLEGTKLNLLAIHRVHYDFTTQLKWFSPGYQNSCRARMNMKPIYFMILGQIVDHFFHHRTFCFQCNTHPLNFCYCSSSGVLAFSFPSNHRCWFISGFFLEHFTQYPCDDSVLISNPDIFPKPRIFFCPPYWTLLLQAFYSNSLKWNSLYLPLLIKHIPLPERLISEMLLRT